MIYLLFIIYYYNLTNYTNILKMDSLKNKIKKAINNGWFLKISFSNFIDIIDYLLPSKNLINIEVISSGVNLIKNLEINENTLIYDIYDVINKEIKYPYYFKLYKDNKRQYQIKNSYNSWWASIKR